MKQEHNEADGGGHGFPWAFSSADKPVRARQGFSGCRGAAMTQSRSDSGVYTGLICYGGVTLYKSASCGRENAAAGRTGEHGGCGDITPPRSLGRFRSCRSAAAGVTCTRIRAKAYGMTNRARKDAALPFSIGSAP
ncbi:hypothetical protein J4727_01940 [Providencia rettgeri]|uniref:Uncharacterized protein n=1 Tax=Providencia rettgeri TaxID=587 RepID=A0A939NGC4_PRORE|nr:hypothetical protein [Providencia rettgeri]